MPLEADRFAVKTKKTGDVFDFFRPDMTHTPGEGRDPRIQLDKDPLTQHFPTDNHVGFFLFACSLVIYLATMSWKMCPGPPTSYILAILDPTGVPPPTNALWGWFVKGLAILSIRNIAGIAGVFSAICGAWSVAILARLMMRNGYLIRNEPGRKSFFREAQARRLSGLAAGFFMMFSIPIWVASTRTMPDTFNVLLLMFLAWFISEYRHRGKSRYLFLSGFLFGACAAESASFLIFLLPAVFILFREIFRWQAFRFWKTNLCLWGGWGIGLFLYVVIAYLLFKRSALTGAYISPVDAVVRVLMDQFNSATQLRFSAGFFVVVAVTIVPWLTLYPLSSRSPWFHEWGQVSVRILFGIGLLATLFDFSFSPWQMVGFGNLMPMPYVIMASCMGTMVGEFWILGEDQTMLDYGFKLFLRRASTVSAILLILTVIGAGALHWRTVDGRHAAVADRAVQEVLERMQNRNILFTTGLLDESLALAVIQQKIPMRILRAGRLGSGPYLQQMSKQFAGEAWQVPLEQQNFGKFLDYLLMSDEGLPLVGSVDLADMFREFAYVVPNGFLNCMEVDPSRISITALVDSQRPFWEWMEQTAANPMPKSNILRGFEDRLRLIASKVANDLALLQIDRGDEVGALDTLRHAHRFCPENWSVLMNLLSLARTHDCPELAEWEELWKTQDFALTGERWTIAMRYGYVWNPREWVRRGFVWALSGAPAVEEARRRKPAITNEEDATNDNRAQVLDQAYLIWGQQPRDDNYYRMQLMQSERNHSALMAMARLALRRADSEIAEAFISEALALGMDEKNAMFDRAIMSYIAGDQELAVRQLVNLSGLTPSDYRVWVSIVLLADEEDAVSISALKRMKGSTVPPAAVHLVLGHILMSRQEWAAAQAELDLVIQQEPRNTQAWQMLVILAQTRGNAKLLDTGLKALLDKDADHFLQYQNAGVEAYRKGNLATAEKSFREGLLRERDATILNNLAHVICEREGNLNEALQLINEALLRQPNQAQMLSTRGEVLMKLGRFKEALPDLLTSVRKQGRSPHLLLLLAQTYEGLGDRTRTATLLRTLESQSLQLSPKQVRKLKEVKERQKSSKPKEGTTPLAPPGAKANGNREP